MKNILKLFLLLFTVTGQTTAQIPDYNGRKSLLKAQLTKVNGKVDSIFTLQEILTDGLLCTTKGTITDHPYLFENSWFKGEIYYSGKIFKSDFLRYDICSGKLINMFQNDSASYPVGINNNIAREFIINGHRFIYLDDIISSDKQKTTPGYFEVLYDGKIRFYIRWEKIEETNRFTLSTGYNQKISFFLKRDDNYFPVKNHHTFVRAFGKYSSEIGSFMKTNKIRFSPKNYDNILKVLEYYDNM